MTPDKIRELARDICDETQRARYGACAECDGALNDAGECDACGWAVGDPEPPKRNPFDPSAAALHAYVQRPVIRGLRVLAGTVPCESLADALAARVALASLYSSTIGAGRNTYHASVKRYRDACRAWDGLVSQHTKS